MKEAKEDILVHQSCGNVFADLGLENAEELFLKANLLHQIKETIAKRKLTKAQMASKLALPQAKLSLLLRLDIDAFTTAELLHFLTCLDQDFEIVVRDKPSNPLRQDKKASIISNTPVALRSSAI
jgi:predicted XRE-type DNA-binding protein